MNNKNKFLTEITPTPKVSKKLKLIFIVLVFAVVAILIWVNRVNLMPSNVGIWSHNKIKSVMFGKGFPYNLEENKIAAENFKISAGNLIFLGNASFVSSNSSMQEIHSSKHNFGNPSMKSSGLRVITYDLGGKNFKIQSLAGEIFSGETEKEIITCDIAENGNYAVITRSNIYLAELTIFNLNNKEKYKYYFSDCYITDISLDSSGTKAAVCGIFSENVSATSNIYILDFKSEKPKYTIEISENYVYYINYFENGNITAIGDKFSSIINPTNCKKQDFNFEGEALKFFDFNKKRGVAFCFEGAGEKIGDSIIIIDENGNKRLSQSFDESFTSISFNFGKFATLSQNSATIHNLLTFSESKINIESGFKKILLTSGNKALILGDEFINRIRF